MEKLRRACEGVRGNSPFVSSGAYTLTTTASPETYVYRPAYTANYCNAATTLGVNQ